MSKNEKNRKDRKKAEEVTALIERSEIRNFIIVVCGEK